MREFIEGRRGDIRIGTKKSKNLRKKRGGNRNKLLSQVHFKGKTGPGHGYLAVFVAEGSDGGREGTS